MLCHPRASMALAAVVVSLAFVAGSGARRASASAHDRFGKGIWTEVAQRGSRPNVRGEFTAVFYDEALVLHGGCDITFSVFYNDTWRFSPAAGQWHRLHTTGAAPAACGHGAVVLGNSMYVYGGLTDGPISDKLHFLDFKSLAWKSVVKPATEGRLNFRWPPPRALIQHSMVALNSTAFAVISGISDNSNEAITDNDETWLYSIGEAGSISGSWYQVTSGELGQSNVGGSAAVVANGTIILSGGFRSDLNLSSAVLNMLGALQSGQSSFQPISGNPPNLAFHAAAADQGCVFIMGGFNATNVSPLTWVAQWPKTGTVTMDWHVLETSIATNMSPSKASYPPPHFAFGMAHDNERSLIYMYGGRIHPSGHHEELAGDMWRLDVSQACPRLQNSSES